MAFLIQPHMRLHEWVADEAGFFTAEGLDYDVQDAANAIEPYFSEIAKEIAQKHATKRILAFLPLVATSQNFVAACRREGINAVHIDGQDEQRDEKLEAFRQGQIQLLSNSNLLHTGVDVPACDCTLNLRPTRSKVLYQQIVGRSTRTLPGVIDGQETVQGRLQAIARSAKPAAYILDPLWLSEDHDLVTPASLVAETEEEAEQMRAQAPGSYSLRALHSNVQREREEAMRRRFEATARFREGRVQADYFAAAIHDHALFNYRAVYAWENQPASKFSRLLLDKAGIDPDSVPTEGFARAVLRAVGRRRYHGRAEIRDLAGAAAKQVADIWDLPASEARKY